MSDQLSKYPRVNQCRRENATGIFNLAEQMESEISDLKLLLHARNTAEQLLVETLYNALHDIAPHYDSLVSRFLDKERQSAYRALYTISLNAMNAKSQYDEERSK